MKAAFKRELALLVDNEIKTAQKENKQKERLKEYTLKTMKISEEQEKLEEAKKLAKITEFQMKVSRNAAAAGSTTRLTSASVRKSNDMATSQRSFMQKFGDALDGTGKTATVVRLRAENEEKAQRALEMQDLSKEIQDEKYKQMQLSMA